MYSIIDIKTTGFGSSRNKITDISILYMMMKKGVNEFQSLVNPECKISELPNRIKKA